MTALNMWQDGRTAFILNDTAIYGPTGILIADQAKTISINGLAFGQYAAVACTGALTPEVFAMALNGRAILTATDLITLLPEVLADIGACGRTHWPDHVVWPGAGMAVAIFDPLRPHPDLIMIADEAGGVLPGDYTPFMPIAVRYWTTGMVPAGPFTYKGKGTAIHFDPYRDGLAIMESQRADVWPDGKARIGGSVVLTTIGAAGVKSEILHTWPDEIGQPIIL
ncbi:hypothetical protein [Sphingobium sp.]|uniref:hypothetical protein n=1 Tax=Sphingobium sp. TaxID=1912891 RepID=UPI00260FF0E1|nr:hypothetical protein [Sphingobium sp.]